MGKSPEQGAATTVFCALRANGGTDGGKYFADSAPLAPSKVALDQELAKRAWDVSVQLVGLTPEKIDALLA